MCWRKKPPKIDRRTDWQTDCLTDWSTWTDWRTDGRVKTLSPSQLCARGIITGICTYIFPKIPGVLLYSSSVDPSKKIFTTGFNIYRCGSLTVLLLSTATLQHTLLYSFTDISFFDFQKRSELLFKMIIFRIEFEIIFLIYSAFVYRSFSAYRSYIFSLLFRIRICKRT